MINDILLFSTLIPCLKTGFGLVKCFKVIHIIIIITVIIYVFFYLVSIGNSCGMNCNHVYKETKGMPSISIRFVGMAVLLVGAPMF